MVGPFAHLRKGSFSPRFSVGGGGVPSKSSDDAPKFRRGMGRNITQVRAAAVGGPELWHERIRKPRVEPPVGNSENGNFQLPILVLPIPETNKFAPENRGYR